MDIKLFGLISLAVGIPGLLIFRNLAGLVGITGAIIMAAILIFSAHKLAKRRSRIPERRWREEKKL